MNPRRVLLELYDAALRAVEGRGRVAEALRGRSLPGPVELFAIGKAASAMTLGAHEALGSAISRTLVITKDGHADADLASLANLTLIETAHPVPDERSLAAGAELERRIDALGAGVTPLFLVSGGSSSLVESLADGATLEDLRSLNERGLAAGWDIVTLNRERRRLSRLKGGGVARRLGSRAALALFISDVPGDDPDVIGSGLLGRCAEPDFIERRVVAGITHAMQAVIDAAAQRGLHLARVPGRSDGEAVVLAHDFVTRLRECGDDGLVWGGESTVVLSETPGRGGRNQHLALAAARALRAQDPLTLLCAGTDGTDGPTGDAGAIVDAGTVERAELAGVDVERAFDAFDSGAALEASGDLLHTGPTGTNVGDILIGITQARRRLRDPTSSRVL